MTNNKPPLPTRKNTRWDKQDYSTPGEYMITICVRDMKQILSKITAGNPQTVGDDVLVVPHPTKPAVLQGTPTVPHQKPHLTNGYAQTVGDVVLDVPHIELTRYGKIADKYINQLNDFYKNINVLKYVIMPNHIHLLLQIPDGTTRTSSPTKTTDGTKCEITPSPMGERTDARSVEHSIISDFISTFKRFVHRDIGEQIFQRSYHDHVIRDENDLNGAINYIENNPYRWMKKDKS